MKIILASQSPRRRELLSELGFTFDIVVPDICEDLIDGLSPAEFAAELSRRKLEAVLSLVGDAVPSVPRSAEDCRPYTRNLKSDHSTPNDQTTIIAADTIVALGNRILGKPADEREAFEMLRTLSGGWHSVFTGLSVGFVGVGLACPPTTSTHPQNDITHPRAADDRPYKNIKITTRTCETRVKFRELSDEEILAYIQTGEPFDKAGGYGIQGAAGDFVESYDGSYTNVVGLPTEMLATILKL